MKLLQCLSCAHYISLRRCSAFPKGIPHEIYSGRVVHNVPYVGDKGILFQDREVKELSKKALPPVTRVDHVTDSNVVEHFTSINNVTRKMTSYLVVALPTGLVEQSEQRRKSAGDS